MRAMEYEVIHRTVYEYGEPVTVSQSAARLRPQETGLQAVEEFVLEIFPVPDRLTWRTDYFGNMMAVFSIREQHARMEVLARSRVKVRSGVVHGMADSPRWEAVAARFRDPVAVQDAVPYEFCLESAMVRTEPMYAEWARESFGVGRAFLEGVRDLMRRIHRDFRFDASATDVATPLGEVWKHRRGVCQDFAHVMIACMRSMGLPARYVSGYLRTIPPPGQARLQGADASHAWVSVFCPVNGWVEFDPTNDVIPADGHVRVAVGRDFSDVSPLNGVLTGGGDHIVRVEVDVIPMDKEG